MTPVSMYISVNCSRASMNVLFICHPNLTCSIASSTTAASLRVNATDMLTRSWYSALSLSSSADNIHSVVSTWALRKRRVSSYPSGVDAKSFERTTTQQGWFGIISSDHRRTVP